MPTFEDVRRLGARLPEVEEAPSYRRMPALKARGRPFCRLWSPAEHDRDGVQDTEVLVVYCDPDEKEVLLDTSSPRREDRPDNSPVPRRGGAGRSPRRPRRR